MAVTKSDLFEPDALTAGVLDLLGPGLSRVIDAADSGHRERLRTAEREWAVAASEELQIDIGVSGIENIQTQGQYVVAPLHEGFADVLALLHLPLALTWVIRDELLELPYFGSYLRAAGHIAVEPESPRTAFRKILAATETGITEGESIVVFPQGSLLGLDIAFQPGAFRLAQILGLPVLPVVLTGSHRVWEYPFSPKLRRNQKIRIEVLPPVASSDAVARMRGLENDMKLRALAVNDAPARRYVPSRDGKWPGYSFVVDETFDSASLERF